MNGRPKSIFYSKTFWAITTAAITGIAPIAQKAADIGRLTISDATAIAIILFSSTAGVMARATASDPLYTPHGLPGKNKEDF